MTYFTPYTVGFMLFPPSDVNGSGCVTNAVEDDPCPSVSSGSAEEAITGTFDALVVSEGALGQYASGEPMNVY